MTPFARLLLVLIILAPLAYIGASYLNGEDGIENLKNLLGFGDKEKQEQVEAPATGDPAADTAELPAQDSEIQKEVDSLRERVQQLEEEKKQLELDLREKELEIRELKLQQTE